MMNGAQGRQRVREAMVMPVAGIEGKKSCRWDWERMHEKAASRK